MDKKILLCGNRSFVAKGLYELLISHGIKVDCFSRGTELRKGDTVTGNVFNMIENEYLAHKYNTVINFIIIKEGGVDDNLRYIKELVQFCKDRGVKRLIHISSIIVYNNKESYVSEDTFIEENTNKVGYGVIKIEVDKYLQSFEQLPFQISFIRPGYVLAEDRENPFLKILPLGIALIKGDKKSILPIVMRADFHLAILNIIIKETMEKVYLFVPSDNKTKYEYLKGRYKYRFIFLPQKLILGVGKLFIKTKILPKSLFVRLESMFIETKYDSTKTERLLNIKF
jgi:dTDP-4-dehydrorhamnose reductase